MIDPTTIDLQTLPSVALADKAKLPSAPCIYFAIDSQGTIQYIGRTINLNQRWVQHHRSSQLLKMESVRISYLFADANLLLGIEKALIEWFQPSLNGSEIELDSKKRMSLYLEESVKTDLERLAKLRKRSLSNLIEVLCEEAVTAAKESGEFSND